jgi:hypothetical protein
VEKEILEMHEVYLRKSGSFGESACRLALVKECGTTARPDLRSSSGFLVDQLPNNYDNYTAIQLQGIVQKVKDPISSVVRRNV